MSLEIKSVQTGLGLNDEEFKILFQEQYAHLVADLPNVSFFKNRVWLNTQPWGEEPVTHVNICKRIYQTADSDTAYITEHGSVQFYWMGNGFVYRYEPDDEAVADKVPLLGYVGNLGGLFNSYGTWSHATYLFDEIVSGKPKWRVFENVLETEQKKKVVRFNITEVDVFKRQRILKPMDRHMFPSMCNWVDGVNERTPEPIKASIVQGCYTLWKADLNKVQDNRFQPYGTEITFVTDIELKGEDTRINDILDFINNEPDANEQTFYSVKGTSTGFRFKLMDHGVLLFIVDRFGGQGMNCYYYGALAMENRESFILNELSSNDNWMYVAGAERRLEPGTEYKVESEEVKVDVYDHLRLKSTLAKLDANFHSNKLDYELSQEGLSALINDASDLIKVANVLLAKDIYKL